MFGSLISVAQNKMNIVPIPAKINFFEGNAFFVIDRNTKIVLGPEGQGLEKFSDLLNLDLKKNYGFTLTVIKDFNPPKKNYINIGLRPPPLQNITDGVYSININEYAISIMGSKNEDLFHGLQTLLQMLQPGNDSKINDLRIPLLTIIDQPRFPYLHDYHPACLPNCWRY